MDVARHDADLAFIGGDHAGAIGADQPRLAVRQYPFDPHHVQDRNTLGDADDQRDAGVDGFQDRIGGKGRGHIDDAGGGPGLADRLLHGIEDRQIEMARAAFARRDAADHLRAIGNGLLGMEGALRAGEALADDLRIAVDEHGHQAASFTALTIFSAASARLSAETMGSPDSRRIFLPSPTLVPSRRTTSGTPRLISLAAATTPSAMTSQRMMPPKMLTRIPSTW